MQAKEQLVFLISRVTEVGVPRDFCLYFWQSQYRNSLIHFKHIIILRNLLRLEMKKPKVWRTCWADIRSPAWGQHCGQRRESCGCWLEPIHVHQKKNSCCSEKKMIFRAALHSVSLWSPCLFSPDSKVHAGCTGCDGKWMSTWQGKPWSWEVTVKLSYQY